MQVNLLQFQLSKMAKKQKKRVLTHGEEFDVMKLVFDKFLWLATLLLFVGIFFSITRGVESGFWFILAGALIMFIFAWILIKQFERMR